MKIDDKKGRNISSYKKGVLTIEAAFLIPFLMMLFIMLIYLSLFLYDRCVITQNTYIACLRGSLYDEKLDENVYDRREYLEKQTETLYGCRSFVSYKMNWYFEDKKDEIEINTKSYINTPFHSILYKMGLRDVWNMEIEKKVPIRKEIDLIRNIRKIQKRME